MHRGGGARHPGQQESQEQGPQEVFVGLNVAAAGLVYTAGHPH